MTATLFVACIVWLFGFMLAVQAMSNNVETTLCRGAILTACTLWPVAVIVAIIRIAIAGSSGELK